MDFISHIVIVKVSLTIILTIDVLLTIIDLEQVEYIRQSFSLKYISIKYLVYLLLGIPLSIIWDESNFRVLLQFAD